MDILRSDPNSLYENVFLSTVLSLEWTLIGSILVPVATIKPLIMGNLLIQKVSALNANFIKDNKLGPGALIQIYLKGDILPVIYKVITPSFSNLPQMPLVPYKGTYNEIDIILADNSNRNVTFVQRLLDKAPSTFMAFILDLCAYSTLNDFSVQTYANDYLQSIFAQLHIENNPKIMCIYETLHEIIIHLDKISSISTDHAYIINNNQSVQKYIEHMATVLLRGNEGMKLRQGFDEIIKKYQISLYEYTPTLHELRTDLTSVIHKDDTRVFSKVSIHTVLNGVYYNWYPHEFAIMQACEQMEIDMILWALAQGMIGDKTQLRANAVRALVSMCTQVNATIAQISRIKTALSKLVTRLSLNNTSRSYTLADLMENFTLKELISKNKQLLESMPETSKLREIFSIMIKQIRYSLMTNKYKVTIEHERNMENFESYLSDDSYQPAIKKQKTI